MSYQILVLRRAQKELADTPENFFERIRDAIFALADEPRPNNRKKLVGRDGWRIRVGVVYEIDDQSRRVTVLHVGHRRDIYN